MNKLYLLVIEFYHYDVLQEAEWVHVVRDKRPTIEEQEKIASEHLTDALDLEGDIGEIDLKDVWCNEVKEVDKYNVIVKERK